MHIDGQVVAAEPGATILEVCDSVGLYVPRLCHFPGLGCAACATPDTSAETSGEPARVSGKPARAMECGLCAVEAGDGSTVLACVTPATADLEVTTDTPGLKALRLERLAGILSRHPHVCLSCPDAEGCSRDQCTYGNPEEARCCAEFGRCELGKLVAWMDPGLTLPRRPVAVPRGSITEGRIRYEAGLCIGCGRCVIACRSLTVAGDALELGVAPGAGAEARVLAMPKDDSLRGSGCTFCGQCVLVCPAGAFTAPGERGAEWLAGRRDRSNLAAPVLPPAARAGRRPFERQVVAEVASQAGVFTLLDADGAILVIRGVADLRRGLLEALDDAGCAGATLFELELDELYTRRESELLARYAQEHGGLPAANDLDDDLF